MTYVAVSQKKKFFFSVGWLAKVEYILRQKKKVGRQFVGGRLSLT